MKIRLLTVGTKTPSWVKEGFETYAKRFPREMPLLLDEASRPPHRGTGGAAVERAMQLEADRMLARIRPAERVVALDERGSAWSTPELARQLTNWRSAGTDVVLLVGGPAGLADRCKARANAIWSLSPLTLPHALVRVVVAEQLYRAWTLLSGHPYHRGSNES